MPGGCPRNTSLVPPTNIKKVKRPNGRDRIEVWVCDLVEPVFLDEVPTAMERPTSCDREAVSSRRPRMTDSDEHNGSSRVVVRRNFVSKHSDRTGQMHVECISVLFDLFTSPAYSLRIFPLFYA